MTASNGGSIFRVRSSSTSVTGNQLAKINLTQTASTTNSDGGGCPQDVPSTPPSEQQKQQSGKDRANVERPKSKKSKTPFGKKIQKLLTSTRSKYKDFDSYNKNQSRTSSRSSSSSSSSSGSSAQATLHTSYEGINDYQFTSSEQDPSPFQVELPTKKEIIVHSRICSLMDGYASIHRDIDFAALSGLSRSYLEQEYARTTKEMPVIAGSCHRDIAQKLLACGDDIVVEAFVREYEYTDEENDKESERMEACIFSSDSLRQIIVCFKGMALNKGLLSGKERELHILPVCPVDLIPFTSLTSQSNVHSVRLAPCILHEDQRVPIMATFRTAYFGTPIEKKVFALLANITARKPFFDVIMVGHSSGAAMAAIAALRYALANCQMRVSCHVFGSPRIGGEEWRQMVHSTPNLRVHRIENGSDPYVSLPGRKEWTHCGHAIQFSGGAAVEFKARRFDRRSSATSNNRNLFTKSAKGKLDHKIQSYDEKLTSSGDRWPTDFCEMKGDGIQADNEARTLA